LITALNHNIQNILKILLQIIFHIAISDFFFIAATTHVASSGKEVPTATIVSHITISLIPNIFAICIAPSTIHCQPKVSQINQKIINKTDFHTDIFFTLTSSDKSFSLFAIPKT